MTRDYAADFRVLIDRVNAIPGLEANFTKSMAIHRRTGDKPTYGMNIAVCDPRHFPDLIYREYPFVQSTVNAAFKFVEGLRRVERP